MKKKIHRRKALWGEKVDNSQRIFIHVESGELGRFREGPRITVGSRKGMGLREEMDMFEGG